MEKENIAVSNAKMKISKLQINNCILQTFVLKC